MIYGCRQRVTEEFIEDNKRIGNEKNYMNHITSGMFSHISNEVQNNLKHSVKTKIDSNSRCVDYSLELVIYGKDEFKDKIKILERHIQSLPEFNRRAIMNLFTKDHTEEQLEKHKNNGRVYI